MPREEALPIAKQIVEALEYAHEKGIIHRDLKPANVKLTSDGKVKLLDFGLAKELPAGDLSKSPTFTMKGTRTGVILGTAAYMPPEQAQGKPVDRRADIWAFGVVLYEMFTGKQLYTGENVAEILAAVIKDEPDLEGLPVQVRSIVERCLRKDPHQRWQSIGDVRIAIEEGAEGKQAYEPYQSAKVPAADFKTFRADPLGSEATQNEPHGLVQKFLGLAGSRPYRLWRFQHLNACIRCAVLVYLALWFRNVTTVRWSLILLLLVTVCCTIQTIISAVLLLADEMDRQNLPKYARRAAPWLRAVGLANGLFALVMAALVAEFHTFLALFLTLLGVAIAFTAIVLRPAMDRAALRSGE